MHAWIRQHKALAVTLAFTLLFIASPLVAMLFTDDVNWGIEDFVTAAGLPFVAYLIYVFISKATKNPLYRNIVAVTLVASLLIIITELAVGIFD